MLEKMLLPNSLRVIMIGTVTEGLQGHAEVCSLSPVPNTLMKDGQGLIDF